MDHNTVRQHYTAHARRYALLMRPFAGVRRCALAHLALVPGMHVLELACGTGTSFAALAGQIGPHGRLIGVDLSRAMLQVARAQVDQLPATPVQLVNARAEHLPLAPAVVDAVLVFYSNDVLTNGGALDHALAALRPGGRFVIAGARLTRGLAGVLLNPLTRSYAERSIITRLSHQPWQALAARLGPLVVEAHLGGSAFVASGTRGW